MSVVPQQNSQQQAPAATPAAAPNAPAQQPATQAQAPAQQQVLDAPKNSTGGADGEGSLLGSATATAAASATQVAQNDGGEKQSSPGVPEQYADFKLPEGVQANPALLEQFKGVARHMGLSQEQAQMLVDIQTNSAIEQANAITTASQEMWKQTTETWRNETLQALGANHKSELAYAARAIDRFGSQELRQFFDDTGLGNHKELALFLAKVGRAVSEDTFADGKGGQHAQKSAAQVIYPNHPTTTQ